MKASAVLPDTALTAIHPGRGTISQDVRDLSLLLGVSDEWVSATYPAR